MLASERLHGIGELADDGGEVDLAGGADVGLHLDAGKGQEVVDQAAHARTLVVHDLQEALARRGILAGGALQGLDEANEGGERGAQLVAGIGNEVDADLLGAALLGKVVEDEGDGRRRGLQGRQPGGERHLRR